MRKRQGSVEIMERKREIEMERLLVETHKQDLDFILFLFSLSSCVASISSAKALDHPVPLGSARR